MDVWVDKNADECHSVELIMRLVLFNNPIFYLKSTI